MLKLVATFESMLLKVEVNKVMWQKYILKETNTL